MKNHLFLAGAALIVGMAGLSASVITFESPYTLGTLGNGANQQGWSNTTSDGNGQIVSGAVSGSYNPGQVATSGGTGGVTYIGGNNSFVFSGTSGNLLTFSFDFNRLPSGSTNNEVYFGSTEGSYTTSTFVNNNANFMIGNIVIGTTNTFGIRVADFGTRIDTGVATSANTWYRMTAVADYTNYGTTGVSLTLSAFDLTNNLTIDLNGGSAGNDYTTTLSAAQAGSNLSGLTGAVIRTTGSSQLNNLSSVPEPAAVLAILGGTIVLTFRRRSRPTA